MARQYSLLPGQLHLSLRRLKYICLGLVLAVLMAVLHPASASEPNLTAVQQQAQALIDRGEQQLSQGYPAAAIEFWQQANQLFRKVQNIEGIAGSLINQSVALQALGQFPRACTTLANALKMEQAICPSLSQPHLTPEQFQGLVQKSLAQQPPTPLLILGLRNLGETLRQLSQPEQSKTVLNQGLTIAQQLNPQPDTSGLLLSLGNTEKTLYSRAKAVYANQGTTPTQQSEAFEAIQETLNNALEHYQQASNNTQSLTTAISAQLNRLSLLTDMDLTADQAQYQTELQSLRQAIKPQILPLVQQLQTADFSRLAVLESANARINFASSLLRLVQTSDLMVSQAVSLGIQSAQTALQTGMDLGNRRIQSIAAGTLGQFYKVQANIPQARQQFTAALGWAESIQAWDLDYQWQDELGRLSQAAGDRDQATKYYRGAVASLEQVRGQLLSVDPEYQFSFKEKVEPIYQQFMRLLFDSNNPNYDEILQVNEQLRLAELENYLQCGRLNLVSPTKLTGSHPTFVYVLNLGDRFEEIVLSPNGTLHRHTPNGQILSDNANLFLTYLEGKTLASTPETVYLPYAQALYDQLITPIKSFIPTSGTLVFSLDTTLQNIPMDLLFDGEAYLFEHYSTALTLGSQIQPPQALPGQTLNILLAGISQTSPSFQSPLVPAGLEPLPGVQIELDSIRKMASSNKALLNQAFSRKQFQDVVNANSFPIVHVATHGQFSSDPQQTIILAWDRPIKVSEFNAFLQGQQGNRLALELLTLSACETAQGDKRSALGLAGMAVRAGARSTLASLWLADEASTPELMSEFYKNLIAGFPKAEAKRQAQLTLRRKPQTANPYLWGGFVLVGGWL